MSPYRRGVLGLDPIALEQVVLRLLHDRLVQVMAFGDLPRGTDLVGCPLARAPIERLARRHDVVHRPDRLLDRRLGVGPMAEDEVEEVEPEADRATPRRPASDTCGSSVLRMLGTSPSMPQKNLVRHHERLPRPSELGDDPTHDRFALAAGVGLGVVEEVAARVERRLHALQRQVVVESGCRT